MVIAGIALGKSCQYRGLAGRQEQRSSLDSRHALQPKERPIVTGFEIQRPYLLFLGNARDQLAAKTAQGILDWRPDWCLGQMRLPGCNADLQIKDMDFQQAAKAGAKTVIVGVANRGGVLSPDWVDMLAGALELGMDLASGLHQRL